MICASVAFVVGLYTTHITPGIYNEDNNLVGFQCNQIAVTTFSNSYNNRSYMLGWDMPVYNEGGYKVGVMPSAVTGYNSSNFTIKVPDAKVYPVPVIYGQAGFLRLSWMLTAVHMSIHLEF